MDIVDKTKRSQMMAGIKHKDTKAELLIRKSLHALGFRYQLHRKDIPGRPDLVFPKFRALILINGCFWHAHHCYMFRWPSSRADFWRAKITSNKVRDEKNYIKCAELGWRTLIIWECSLKGKTKRPFSEVINTAENWLLYDSQNAEIEGRNIC